MHLYRIVRFGKYAKLEKKTLVSPYSLQPTLLIRLFIIPKTRYLRNYIVANDVFVELYVMLLRAANYAS